MKKCICSYKCNIFTLVDAIHYLIPSFSLFSLHKSALSKPRIEMKHKPVLTAGNATELNPLLSQSFRIFLQFLWITSQSDLKLAWTISLHPRSPGCVVQKRSGGVPTEKRTFSLNLASLAISKLVLLNHPILSNIDFFGSNLKPETYLLYSLFFVLVVLPLVNSARTAGPAAAKMA